MAEPKMIPWHLPELRAIRDEVLSGMARTKAMEDRKNRIAFERFMAIAMRVAPRKRKGRRK